jgi:hypothetical protein
MRSRRSKWEEQVTTQKPKPKVLNLDKRAHQIIALASVGNPDDLLTDAQLAELLGVNPQWPCQARIKGYSPPFKPLGPRHIRYRRESVIAWLRSRAEYTSNAESPYRGKVWNSPHRQGNGAAAPTPNRFKRGN